MRPGTTPLLLAMLCAACSGSDEPGEAVLASLTPSVGTLSPAFSPMETRYDLPIPSWVSDVHFTLKAMPEDATIEVEGLPAKADRPTADIPVGVGSTPIQIDVRSSSGGRRRYEVIVARSGVQPYYIKASNTGAGDNFGRAVSLSGDLLAVGAPQEDSSAAGVGGDQGNNALSNSGAVYVFRFDGATWIQEAYLKPLDPRIEVQFGTRVSLSGDTLAVGTLTGEVAYVFRRSGATWSQEARLVAPSGDVGDAFGRVVSLSGDTLAVTAESEGSAATGVNGDQSDNSAPGSGAVYIFRRSGATWSQEAYLKSAVSARDAGLRSPLFGVTASLDGDVLAVNSLQEATTYIFRRSGTTWAKEYSIDFLLEGAATTAVAVSGDTLFASFGQPSYVFRRKGAVWRKEAAIDVARNGFPSLVGGALVFGLADVAGAAVYRRDEANTWRRETSLAPPGGSSAGSFGGTCSLSGDRIAVGAQSDDSSATGVGGDTTDTGARGSGAVFVFH